MTIDFFIAFDLRDAGWRRLLGDFYANSQSGARPMVWLFKSEDEMGEFEDFVQREDVAAAINIGFTTGDLARLTALSGIDQIEEQLTDDEVAAVPPGQDPIVRQFRQRFPSIIDIDPDVGGGLGATLSEGGFPLFIIDPNQADPNGIVQEAAVRTLLRYGFTRLSSMERIFPAAENWFAILLSRHVIIAEYRPGREPIFRTLFAGPAAINREWRESAARQKGLPVVIANLRLLRPEDEAVRDQPIEDIVYDRLSAAVTFQQAAGASVRVIEPDLRQLRASLDSAREFDREVLKANLNDILRRSAG